MKFRNRRLAATLVVASLSMVGLSACATPNSGNAGSNAKDTTPISILTDNTAWKDGLEKTGKEIAKTTGREFDVKSVPDASTYAQVRDQSLEAKPADIVKTSVGLQLAALASGGNLTDLTDVWDAAVANGNLDDALRPMYSYKGKVYAVPYGVSYSVVFYSKAAFEKAGITATPSTYDEFTADADKLKAAGITPIFSGYESWRVIYPYSLIAGSISADFYNKLTTNKAKFDDAVGKQTLTEWQDWLQKGWVNVGDTDSTQYGKLKAGTLGMYPSGTWNSGDLIKAGMQPGKDYGAFLMPQHSASDPQSVFVEGTALAVPKRAAHHDAAVKQIAGWLEAGPQTVWSNYLNDTPFNPKVKVDNSVIADVTNQVNAGDHVSLVRYFEAVPPPLVQNSITAWANFALHPDQYDQTIKALTDTAAKDWDTWQQQNQ